MSRSPELAEGKRLWQGAHTFHGDLMRCSHCGSDNQTGKGFCGDCDVALTSVSLARLLRDTNRRDEARVMPGEIYNWFTERFDLPDLKEAKTFPYELGGTAQ